MKFVFPICTTCMASESFERTEKKYFKVPSRILDGVYYDLKKATEKRDITCLKCGRKVEMAWVPQGATWDKVIFNYKATVMEV